VRRRSNAPQPFAGYGQADLPARLAGMATVDDLPLAGAATLTLPTARLEHVETVAAPGVTAGRVALALPAPGTDADENVAEMLDLRLMTAAAGADAITVTAIFDVPTSGPVPILWSVT